MGDKNGGKGYVTMERKRTKEDRMKIGRMEGKMKEEMRGKR